MLAPRPPALSLGCPDPAQRWGPRSWGGGGGRRAAPSAWVPWLCRGGGRVVPAGGRAVSAALTLPRAQLQRKMEERRLRLQEAANR